MINCHWDLAGDCSNWFSLGYRQCRHFALRFLFHGHDDMCDLSASIAREFKLIRCSSSQVGTADGGWMWYGDIQEL